jgi:hypothetical protein
VTELFVHGLQLATRKVFVLSQLLVHRLQKHFVVDFADSQTSLVNDGDNALVGCLNQVADDLVVEVINVGPCDAFALIFLLFLLKYELNEELLELFVAVVDAENVRLTR